jgi:uncharacterized protein involved in oxidation of intracellular sulfur
VRVGGFPDARTLAVRNHEDVNALLVLNDPPYGTERSYNGLRLAGSLAKREGLEVRVFLMGDAVACAVAGQTTPNGYYNLERMIKLAARHGAEVACCGSCLDARGITEEMLTPGARRSSLDELTDWTLWAERIVTF